MRPEKEFLAVEMTSELTYLHSAGRYGSVFLKALKDGLILGSKCGGCGVVQAPPRIICGACWKETGRIVPVGPGGTLLAYTQVTLPFIDPFTGEARPVPYCYGMIQLDGADNAFQHFLEEADVSKVSFGMRVEAVFRTERNGNLGDIRHFKAEGALVSETQPESDQAVDKPDAGLIPGSARIGAFFEIFNQAILSREFGPLTELFSEGAELSIRLLGSKRFQGRPQIEQAFRGLPRKSSLTLLGEEPEGSDGVKARFLLKGLPLKIRGTLIARFNAEGKITAAVLST